MKLLTMILTAAVALSTSSFAAKGENRAEKRREFRKTLRAYDRNRNHQIDGAEVDAVKNAYATFKRLDANSDGSLGDEEIKALNARVGEGKANARKAGEENAIEAKKKRKRAR